MNISIKTITHSKQRLHNGDVCDYFEKDGKQHIRISETHDRLYNLLLTIHELVEFTLIKEAGIPIKTIDKWDCKHPKTKGDDVHAPYHREHVTATEIERFSARQLGIDWHKYSKFIEEFE